MSRQIGKYVFFDVFWLATNGPDWLNVMGELWVIHVYCGVVGVTPYCIDSCSMVLYFNKYISHHLKTYWGWLKCDHTVDRTFDPDPTGRATCVFLVQCLLPHIHETFVLQRYMIMHVFYHITTYRLIHQMIFVHMCTWNCHRVIVSWWWSLCL